MDDTKWARWLRTVTRKDTERDIAAAAGVSHTTVQRWARKGVPPDKVSEMMAKFGADPIEALVLTGWLREEHIPLLNYTALVQYAPGDVLAAELHHRASRYIKANYPDVLRKTRTGLSGPSPSDSNHRQSFRLTAK